MNNSISKESLSTTRILLGVTGSVAAVKGPELIVRFITELHKHGNPPPPVKVRVLLTSGGKFFWDKAKEYDPRSWDRLGMIQKLVPDAVEIYEHDIEWKQWQRMGDPVLHIELRNWADVFVVAPLSANTLAKLANGLCDETLTCVARAWDFGSSNRKLTKTMILAPAMNTTMWEHPLTQQQLNIVQSFAQHRGGRIEVVGVTSTANTTTTNTTQQQEQLDSNSKEVVIVPPQSKMLACGEIGTGAMAAVEDILNAVRLSLRLPTT